MLQLSLESPPVPSGCILIPQIQGKPVSAGGEHEFSDPLLFSSPIGIGATTNSIFIIREKF